MKNTEKTLKIRRIRRSDPVDAVARCLYLTDPYIYPQICDSPEDPLWLAYVACALRQPDSVFAERNSFVAEAEGEIAGVCCLIKGGERYESVCAGAEICQTEGFMKVKRGYFDPLVQENLSFSGHDITNICVLPEFRNRGLGHALLQKAIAAYGEEEIHLDVLAENAAAIALYEKCGFAVTYRYNGFGMDGDVPCLHMLRKAAGRGAE